MTGLPNVTQTNGMAVTLLANAGSIPVRYQKALEDELLFVG